MDRLESLLSFLEEDPNDPFTLFAIAQEYAKRGEDPKALDYYETLVRDHPRYVGTYYHLGKMYQRHDRTDDAKATFEMGIRVAGELTDFHARAELQDALMALQGIGWD